MLRCYVSREHESPGDASYCTACGVPLRQDCPYDSSHRIRVKDDAGNSPRNCSECLRLLRACDDCGRLYRLTDRQCVTGRHPGRPLPPLVSDWPTYGGDSQRTGSRWLRRAWDPELQGALAWPEDVCLSGANAALVSAFGNLYLAVDRKLMLVQPDAKQGTWKNVQLSSPLRPGGGALLAGEGLIFTLQTRHAAAYAADHLTAPRVAVEGSFAHHALDGERWLVYGTPDGQQQPRLLLLPIRDLNNAVEIRGSEGQTLVGPPVMCQGVLYWPGEGGRLYRLDGEQLAHIDTLNGEIVALAAPPERDRAALEPGLYALTRSELGHELVFIPQGSGRNVHAEVVGNRVKPRLWTLGPHVFVARDADSSYSAGLLRYDQRLLAQAPQVSGWAYGFEFLDAVLLDAQGELVLELALRDPNTNAGLFLRQPWSQGGPRQFGRIIGVETAGISLHQDLTMALVRVSGGGVIVRAHRLWDA